MELRSWRLGQIGCLVAAAALYIATASATASVTPGSPASVRGTGAALHDPTVNVVRCPTEFGVTRPVVWPRVVSVLHSPSSVQGLVAYTNSELVLIAPAGLRCWGIVAVDGGTQLLVWPHGHARPTQHASIEGLTLSLDPACVSCKAADACPFFSQFAVEEGFPCPSGVPAGEHVYGLSSNVTLFEDPPGVAGSGWPSGGPYPANGLVGITGGTRDGTVYRSTCTLPAAKHSICTVSLNDVLSRYG